MLGIHVDRIAHYHQITIVIRVKMRDQYRIESIQRNMKLKIGENTASAIDQHFFIIDCK